MPKATSIDMVSQFPFTGRDETIQLLLEYVVCSARPDQYAVMAVTGIGGQGKSRLLDELAKRLYQNDYCAIRLDFDIVSQRDPILGLLHLRQQLVSIGYATPSFDAAYAKLFTILHPGRDIRDD